MGRWLSACFYVFLLGLWASLGAFAAEIEVMPGKIQGYTPISIKGGITLGDDERFEQIALGEDKAIVFLESPGGLIQPGLQIGKLIKLRGYLTAVPEGSQCASACGLIWLAGSERLVFPGGSVGFHVAYREQDGNVTESGQANALVGAYLSKLGLNFSAIEYVTRAPPSSMIWLTQADADKYGIKAYFVPSNDYSAPAASSEPAPEPSAPSSPAPAEAEGPFTRLEKQDIYGFDLPGKAPDAASAQECEQLCERNGECRAYSFNSRKMKCYLKSGGDRIVWNREVTTGYVKALESSLRKTKLVFFSSTELQGAEFHFVLDSTVEACISLCEDRAQCTGFTFARKQLGRCSLRSGRLKKFPAKNILTGVKTSE
jgi:PAN domain